MSPALGTRLAGLAAAFGLAVSVLATEALAQSAGSDSAATPPNPAADLAATTAPPWNPPSAVRDAEPWETALRLPLRIATFPLKYVAKGTRHSLQFVEENNVVPRALAVIAIQERIGIYARPASLGDRTGFGGALVYRPRFLRYLAAEIDGSTARYSRAQLALEYGPAVLGYRSDWRPQDQFFGIGLEAPEERSSTYASRTQALTLTLALPEPGVPRSPTWPGATGTAVVPAEPRAWRPRLSARGWIGPRAVVLSDGRDSRRDKITEQHPAVALVELGTRVEHLVYGARIGLDGRAGRPHWSQGARIGFEAERFDQSIEALALRDAHSPARSFTRLTAEGEIGVSFLQDPRTIRLAVKAIDVRPDEGSGIFLISDLPRLGGSAGLTGYEPGRFHDLDLVLGKLSYIFPLAQFFELDLHAEAGGVFPRLREDATISRLKHSFGVALRPRTDQSVLGRIGVDISPEGARFGFSLGGVE